jgi:hypothetical protein
VPNLSACADLRLTLNAQSREIPIGASVGWLDGTSRSGWRKWTLGAPGRPELADPRVAAWLSDTAANRLESAEPGSHGYGDRPVSLQQRPSRMLATPLFGNVAVALREHGSATLDEHCCYICRPD